MKKVIFCVVGLNTGGIEKYLLRFLKFSNNNIEATIICKSGEVGELESEFAKLDIEIISLKLGYLKPNAILKLYRILKKSDYQAICDFTGGFAAITLFVGRLIGIKNRIAFYRNSEYTFKKSFLKSVFLKFQNKVLLFSATKILSNSKLALDNFHPEWSYDTTRKFDVIKNGIIFKKAFEDNSKSALQNELGISNDCFVIGHVGSFRKQKNHDIIFKIAKELSKYIPDLKVLLVGKGVSKNIKDEIIEKGLEDVIIFAGLRNDVPDLLSIMDAFVFPSLNEGQPNALIEAMIYKVPIFTSNIPTILDTIPEYLHEEYSFDPYDYKGISKKILNLYSTSKCYNTDSVQEWALAEYDPNKQFTKFLEIL